MTPVYGLSEAALAVTFSEVGSPPETRRVERETLRVKRRAVPDSNGMEMVCVGRPLPGFDVEIRDANQRSLPESNVGEIWTRGPSLMSGYLGRPVPTAEAMADGWLDTGDLGFMIEGKLFVTGRSKDVLIVRGQNHAPEEIEAIVASVPGVRAGGCAAVSFMLEGEPTERVLLFIERQSRRQGQRAQELARSAAQKVLALTGIEPDRIEILKPGALPRTSSGKVRRAAIVDRFLAGDLGGLDPAGRSALA